MAPPCRAWARVRLRHAVRWLWPRGGHRGARAEHRSSTGVGHRAVPRLRLTARRRRSRSERDRAGEPGVTGPGARSGGRPRDLHRRGRPGRTDPPVGGHVGKLSGGDPTRSQPASPAHAPPPRHDPRAPRGPAGERPSLGRARRHSRSRRSECAVGSATSRARGERRRPGDRGGLRAVRDRPGPGAAHREHRPRQHPADSSSTPERVGARRHPGAGRDRRPRSRRRAPLGGRSHPAGHGEPIRDRSRSPTYT